MLRCANRGSRSPTPRSQKAMWEDPIVADIHRTRRKIYERFNGDMAAYMDYLGEMTEEERRRGRKAIDTPFRDRQKPKPDAA